MSDTNNIEELKAQLANIQERINQLEKAEQEQASLDSEGPSCDKIALEKVAVRHTVQLAQKREIARADARKFYEYSVDIPRTTTSAGCDDPPYSERFNDADCSDEWIDPFK